MKFTGIVALLAAAVLSLFFISCQKELNYGPAQGSLLDTAGACKNILVNGVYKADSLLGRGNYLEVTVNVTQLGTYYIYSDTVNGFYFKAAGSFPKLGETTVRLAGFGRPQFQAQGNLFNIFFNQSRCNAVISVLPADALVEQFVFRTGSTGSCLNLLLGLPYVVNQPMNVSNYMQVEVDVNKTGPYLITSDTVNGVYFSASGSFTNTGAGQIIDLSANGTPLVADTFTYVLHGGGSSSCPFTVIFTSGGVTSNDYFPLNLSSYWTYDSEETAPDTLFKISRPLVGQYAVFDIGAGAVGLNAFGKGFFRKSAGQDYFQKISVDTFTDITAIPNSNNYQEVLFLKQGTGTANWASQLFSVVDASAPNDTIQIQYVFEQLGLPFYLTAIGKQFNDVIRVNCNVKIRRPGSSSLTPNTIIESYYAKGIGLVEFKKRRANSASWDLVETLRNYKIN